MLYNKNVTRVQIYVERYNIARDAVKSVVEQAANTMANNGCLDVTRETLTPYEVLQVPSGESSLLINFLLKSKFQILIEDFDIISINRQMQKNFIPIFRKEEKGCGAAKFALSNTRLSQEF